MLRLIEGETARPRVFAHKWKNGPVSVIQCALAHVNVHDAKVDTCDGVSYGIVLASFMYVVVVGIRNGR